MGRHREYHHDVCRADKCLYRKKRATRMDYLYHADRFLLFYSHHDDQQCHDLPGREIISGKEDDPVQETGGGDHRPGTGFHITAVARIPSFMGYRDHSSWIGCGTVFVYYRRPARFACTRRGYRPGYAICEGKKYPDPEL